MFSADLLFCRNIDNLAAFAREKCFKLTAAFEKLTYTDAGTNAPSKDVDQVCLATDDDNDDDDVDDDDTAFEKLTQIESGTRAPLKDAN